MLRINSTTRKGVVGENQLKKAYSFNFFFLNQEEN